MNAHAERLENSQGQHYCQIVKTATGEIIEKSPLFASSKEALAWKQARGMEILNKVNSVRSDQLDRAIAKIKINA